MNAPLIDAPAVTILGGGALEPRTLEAALARAPCLVAADGGADAALAAGRTPEAVIGDFDSISPAARNAIPAARQHPDAGQDDTDFQKCLARIRADLVLAVGFLGGRIDHQLAVLSALVAPDAPPCIVIGAEDVVFAAPMSLGLDLAPGTRVSLFPMGPVSGRSQGLRWPIDGLDLAPAGRVGTSNEVTGPVRLIVDRGPMLVILPATALDAAIAGHSRALAASR